MNPKILFYDIESMAERGWYFGKRYEANILNVDHYEHLLSVAWKWYGEDEVHVLGLDDFTNYKRNKHNDYKLVKFISDELFTPANVIVAHNGDNFDQKMVNARLMTHHLRPPEPYKQIDTYKGYKKYARFASNKLDDLSRQINKKSKMAHGDFTALWLACDNGDPAAWQELKDYNKIDVLRLEEIYLELRPWLDNHPAMNLLLNKLDACPNCGEGPLHSKGKQVSKTNVYQRWQCQNCGRYVRSRIADKTTERVLYV